MRADLRPYKLHIFCVLLEMRFIFDCHKTQSFSALLKVILFHLGTPYWKKIYCNLSFNIPDILFILISLSFLLFSHTSGYVSH